MSKLEKSIDVCRTRFLKHGSLNDFVLLLQADPEGGKNCSWLIDNYMRGEFRLEDVQRVRDDVDLFLKSRRRLPVEDRTLAKHTYRELKDIIDQFEVLADTVARYVEGEADVLYNGPDGTLIVPLTENASRVIGAGTKWCTSSRENNMFSYYSKKAPLYVWIDNALPKGRNKFQLWFYKDPRGQTSEIQIMDIKDNPVDADTLKYLREHRILRNYFTEWEDNMDMNMLVKYVEMTKERLRPELEQKIFDSDMPLHRYASKINNPGDLLDEFARIPSEALLYVNYVLKNRPWPEAEPYIMTDPSTASTYAFIALKRRWPEAEPYIMTDPRAAIDYAIDVIRGRWPEAEKYIMTDPYSAVSYASHALQSRWPEAEKYIITHGPSASSYAIHVLKRRWIEAEPTIIRSGDLYRYMVRLVKEPWPEAEERIMEHPRTAAYYAINILKRRWPEAEETIKKDREQYNKYRLHFRITD